MRFAIASAAIFAGIAAAQTSTAAASTPTGGSCQAQNIVDACREGIQSQIDSCKANDWICLCDNYTNLLTCYNNCPDSNERPPVQNQVTQYCNAAAPLKSASASAAATAKTTGAASQASTMTTATASEQPSDATTGTAAGATSSPTGAADALVVPFGGALAVVLGLVAL
ncbi:hypothetical protein EJ04DRAFT_507723 [Polyplosphaeria fusca]|uniref:GPI anchored serine-threonine rich protein n=1 Tax=Polyplosphaeria fusca TaxID=682080 RepID=A0A9P4V8V0_9PLEO|nr:hypothetical protein EJ04DRAFT_507723 [Polyplosphaeria fusca]